QPCDEHHGHPAADGGDQGVIKPEIPCPLAKGAKSTFPQSVLTRPRPKPDLDALLLSCLEFPEFLFLWRIGNSRRTTAGL
ncbi:MAG TPA: hypothetical protein VK430_02460, partial [Xanthobacteraceae bacterium]|nr:hypothetical protein [Xanthobacteraceae bacterium]